MFYDLEGKATARMCRLMESHDNRPVTQTANLGSFWATVVKKGDNYNWGPTTNIQPQFPGDHVRVPACVVGGDEGRKVFNKAMATANQLVELVPDKCGLPPPRDYGGR